ncbi:hypothetical protein [Roseateles koreensis]|uniref:Uncharacterized protein n=1 Tax=Roseateles koreensis TaxID=2987526 RepID=A0ABT5KPJ0_9BURK|nr:hypothetical protein [Roseateles koreensis]MDC8784771.1 hypothetical protein [Roseateles koreensis]
MSTSPLFDVGSLFAVLGLLVCTGLALRMAVGPKRRRQWDQSFHKAVDAARTRARKLANWQQDRRHQKAAAAEAAETIRRAKRKSEGQWDGNVYRPKQFQDKED